MNAKLAQVGTKGHGKGAVWEIRQASSKAG